MRFRYWLLFAALPMQGCGLVHSCTEIGCGNSASVTLRTRNGTWEDGAYTFVFTTPEAAHTCRLAVPAELPASPVSVHQLTCSPALSASLSVANVCSEERSGDSVSQSCRPLAGQFVLQVQLAGTPATLSVRVERSGSVLLEDSRTLKYTEERPNGPDCPPVCRQTSLELILP